MRNTDMLKTFFGKLVMAYETSKNQSIVTDEGFRAAFLEGLTKPSTPPQVIQSSSELSQAGCSVGHQMSDEAAKSGDMQRSGVRFAESTETEKQLDRKTIFQQEEMLIEEEYASLMMNFNPNVPFDILPTSRHDFTKVSTEAVNFSCRDPDEEDLLESAIEMRKLIVAGGAQYTEEELEQFSAAGMDMDENPDNWKEDSLGIMIAKIKDSCMWSLAEYADPNYSNAESEYDVKKGLRDRLLSKLSKYPNIQFETPLHIAVEEGNLSMVKLLLDAKANPQFTVNPLGQLYTVRKSQCVRTVRIPAGEEDGDGITGSVNHGVLMRTSDREIIRRMSKGGSEHGEIERSQEIQVYRAPVPSLSSPPALASPRDASLFPLPNAVNQGEGEGAALDPAATDSPTKRKSKEQSLDVPLLQQGSPGRKTELISRPNGREGMGVEFDLPKQKSPRDSATLGGSKTKSQGIGERSPNQKSHGKVSKETNRLADDINVSAFVHTPLASSRLKTLEKRKKSLMLSEGGIPVSTTTASEKSASGGVSNLGLSAETEIRTMLSEAARTMGDKGHKPRKTIFGEVVAGEKLSVDTSAFDAAGDYGFDSVYAIADALEKDAGTGNFATFENICDWYRGLAPNSWQRVTAFWKWYSARLQAGGNSQSGATSRPLQPLTPSGQSQIQSDARSTAILFDMPEVQA